MSNNEVNMNKNIQEIADRLKAIRLDMELTLAEMAEKMGMPADKIRDIQRISQDPVSIDKPVGEEEDSHLVDFISSDEAPFCKPSTS